MTCYVQKGKGKERAESEDEEGEESNEQDGNGDYTKGGHLSYGAGGASSSSHKDTASHDETDKVLAMAQFSVNILNLFKPPKPLDLGKVNTRELMTNEALKLKKMMDEQGIRAFTREHMIPIVIRRDHVDPECIFSGMNAYNALDFKLSARGIKELKGLNLVGGRHRLAALTSVHEDKMKLLEQARKRTKTIRDRKAVKTDANARRKKDLSEALETEQALQADVEVHSKWGVILYDEGKYKLNRVNSIGEADG